MDINSLYAIASKEEDLVDSDMELLRALVEQYPYFQSAVFSYLKSVYLFDNEQFDNELSRLSITVTDRRALFYHILSEEYETFFKQTGKKELREDRTSVLLNAFFESKGEIANNEDFEYNLINSTLASTDYFSYIETEPERKEGVKKEPDTTVSLKHQSIIDTFISKSEVEGGIHIPISKEELQNAVVDQPKEDDSREVDDLNEDMFFTETLAKIYVKQKKYEKAYKIIKHLSLNYPKKNIYFADQLSFLEKLIINSKYKDTK